MERYLIASPAVRMELDEAELYAVAALGLMKDTVSPSFLECTCEGGSSCEGQKPGGSRCSVDGGTFRFPAIRLLCGGGAY